MNLGNAQMGEIYLIETNTFKGIVQLIKIHKMAQSVDIRIIKNLRAQGIYYREQYRIPIYQKDRKSILLQDDFEEFLV